MEVLHLKDALEGENYGPIWVNICTNVLTSKFLLDGNLPSKNKWLRPLNNNNKKVFIVKLYDVPVVGNTL